MSKLSNGAEREARSRLRHQLNALPDAETSTMELVDVREAIPLERGAAARRFMPVADPRPAPQPEAVPPQGPSSTRRRRRRPFRLLRRLVLVIVLGLAGLVAFQWYSIDRVELPIGLTSASGAGTNVLLVGTDSREGLDASAASESDVYGLGVSGERTDTLLVLHLNNDRNRLLSIPRDLLVTSPSDGGQRRINAVLSAGPDQLIETITKTLDIPIHHYAAVDFAAFLDIVDAIGSVPIEIRYPAYDDRTGFRADNAGTIELDGEQSLAFVRSRRYTEVIDGVPTSDETGDFGRTERQRLYLQAMLGELLEIRNPVVLMRVASAIRTSLTIDDATSILDAVRLTAAVRDLGEPGESVSSTLPVTPTVVDGAEVLLLDVDRAEEVLAAFRPEGNPG